MPCPFTGPKRYPICTHYSCLSGWPDIFLGSETLTNRSKIWVAKSRVKKAGSLLFKREEGAWPVASSVFEEQWPCFLHLTFCNPYFGPFFTGSQTDPYFQNKSGCRLTEWICFAPVETIWARPIIELNWVPLQKVLCWQKNWIYYMKILFWFGPAQIFLGSIKGQGISILHIQWKRQKICYLKPL